VPFSSVPDRRRAVATALDGRRFVESADETGTVIALPVAGRRVRALVAYSRPPDLAAGIGLARDKIVDASLVAFATGALAGCLLAWFLGRRLRRIALGAAEVERGRFDRRIARTFPDEVGMLAETIDRMRERLRDSFSSLESERSRLEQLLARLLEGVVALDGELNVQFANDAARRLFGSTPIEAGRPLAEPFPGFSLRDFAASLFRDGRAIAHRRVALGDDVVLLAGIPAGGSEFAMIVMTDVSQEERRERAEREFVMNAAHELRTPLQTILGAVEALESGAKDEPDDRDRFLAHIAREGQRLARLTRALLVLARAQTREEHVHPQPVELRPLLDGIAETVTRRPGVHVAVKCPSDLRTATEPDLAEQVLANLTGNAANHTEAGEIVIAAASLDDGSVAVEVRDTGNGIAHDEQERVFDRFYRGDAQDTRGFGLGLAIAREGARVLGGRIEIRSRPGEGTTARLVLPAREPSAP
jgi:signal transduction histidine kinase